MPMMSKSKHPELTMLAYAALAAIRRAEEEKARLHSAANAEPELAAQSQSMEKRTSPC